MKHDAVDEVRISFLPKLKDASLTGLTLCRLFSKLNTTIMQHCLSMNPWVSFERNGYIASISTARMPSDSFSLSPRTIPTHQDPPARHPLAIDTERSVSATIRTTTTTNAPRDKRRTHLLYETVSSWAFRWVIGTMLLALIIATLV
jgi:hypothetical protein